MMMRLMTKLALPKEMPRLPEMPRDRVFQALVPAEPASTPKALPSPKTARPVMQTTNLRVYSFNMILTSGVIPLYFCVLTE